MLGQDGRKAIFLKYVCVCLCLLLLFQGHCVGQSSSCWTATAQASLCADITTYFALQRSGMSASKGILQGASQSHTKPINQTTNNTQIKINHKHLFFAFCIYLFISCCKNCMFFITVNICLKRHAHEPCICAHSPTKQLIMEPKRLRGPGAGICRARSQDDDSSCQAGFSRLNQKNTNNSSNNNNLEIILRQDQSDTFFC